MAKTGPKLDKDTEEIRCELIRLYLDQDHPAILRQLQDEVRQATNHIVRSRKDVKNAVIAYALRNGLVGPAPGFPEEPSLPKPQGPEDNSSVREAWAEFRKQKTAAVKSYGAWLNGVFKAVKGLPECEWRKDTYQDLRNLYGTLGSAVLFRDTHQRVTKTKRAKAKKRTDHVPLVFGNSPLVKTGEFYGSRRGVPWYNALITVPMERGLKPLKIMGRLRRPLPGTPIQ